VTAIVKRGLYWLLTLAVALLSAGLVVACLAMASGCGQQQRVVSALAVAAVAADDLNAAAYEVQARAAVDDCRESGGTFEGCWCPAMQTPWERSSRAECAIESLADLAVAGQHVVDAGADLDGEWAGAACEVLRALEAAWTAAEDPPAVVATARGLVCGLADGARAEPPECDAAPVPPPCPEVTP
jgi:hypothetical protein